MQFGDKIVGITPVYRPCELHGAAVRQKRATLYLEPRGSGLETEPPRGFRSDRHGPNPLQGSHGPAADPVQGLVE